MFNFAFFVEEKQTASCFSLLFKMFVTAIIHLSNGCLSAVVEIALFIWCNYYGCQIERNLIALPPAAKDYIRVRL